MASDRSWCEGVEPINFTSFSLPSLDLKAPFVEASNHVSRILGDITAFTPSTGLSDHAFKRADHPFTYVAAAVFLLFLLAITWKVRRSYNFDELIQAGYCDLCRSLTDCLQLLLIAAQKHTRSIFR